MRILVFGLRIAPCLAMVESRRNGGDWVCRGPAAHGDVSGHFAGISSGSGGDGESGGTAVRPRLPDGSAAYFRRFLRLHCRRTSSLDCRNSRAVRLDLRKDEVSRGEATASGRRKPIIRAASCRAAQPGGGAAGATVILSARQ